jgi:3-hydroxyisobutyrate dehydrogenase-like beta-hydroxyacid dehydrogenase
MHIGFIGLGAMGSAIARNLLASGHSLHVYNRGPQRTLLLRSAGATIATSPAQAARGADAVFTMVSDDAALEAVCGGDAGVLAGLAPGAVHVSMSTIGVAFARELAARHRAEGQRFISATVFGRPEVAERRMLHIMAAGAAQDLQFVQPLLEQVGQSTSVVGPEPWHANLVKLAGNFMLMSLVETLAETCTLAAKAGVDEAAVMEALTGTIFNAAPYRNYGPAIAARRFQPAGFALPLAQKDNRLLLATAEALGLPLPLASLLRDRFLAVRARGAGSDHDLAALSLAAFADAGLLA